MIIGPVRGTSLFCGLVCHPIVAIHRVGSDVAATQLFATPDNVSTRCMWRHVVLCR